MGYEFSNNFIDTVESMLKSQLSDKHIEVLNSLIGTTPFGCMNPLSKKTLWKLCILHNWDRKKVLKDIKDDTYWVHFCND